LGYLTESLAMAAQALVLLFLAAHLLELAFAFKHVRLYKGSLIVSVVLTLMFGLLHWMPLTRQHKGN
jgi:hypothetical protein